MPIHIDVFHPNRIVVIVARGTITPEDATAAIREFIEKGAVQYRKIIDVSSASSDLDMERLKAIVALVRSDARAMPRGPLAFVVDKDRNEWARTFAEMTEAERPVKVFTSLHLARRWLDENSRI